MPPVNSDVPKNLVYAGIIVGLLLVFFGIILLVEEKSSLLSSLMTCVGFGIVLACFGSKAGGAWAGWTATGAGAMAIILFLVLMHFTPASFLDPVRRGQLRGDLSKIADIRIIDVEPMYEFRDTTTGSIKFIVLDRALKSQRMSVQVDTTEKGEGREFFELIGSSKLISQRYLSDQTVDVIQWEFDYANRVIKDGPAVVFAEADKLDKDLLPKRQAVGVSPRRSFALVGAAFAQSSATSPTSDGRGFSTRPIEELVSDLTSDDTSIRRNARDALVASGSQVVRPIMTKLRANPSDYRLRGGAVYVLSTILSLHPDQKSAISAALDKDDFPILVSAASDNDKTMRLQAAEFLYILGDPRAVPFSVDAARDTHDNDKASNQISILGQSGQQLPNSKKQEVIRDLTFGPGSNNDLVGKNGWTCGRLFGSAC